MGLINTKVQLRFKRKITAKALVDTGASFSAIPESLARKIGIKPFGKKEVELADGSKKFFPIATAYIKIRGREVPQIVLISPDGEALIGVETLEHLGMIVDPKKRKLKVVRPFKIMLA